MQAAERERDTATYSYSHCDILDYVASTDLHSYYRLTHIHCDVHALPHMYTKMELFSVPKYTRMSP